MSQIFFNSTIGQIEGRYLKSPNARAPLALVLHPHPVYGGSMNNKLVYNLYKSLGRAGFSVLCINFRGVGLSHGTFDDGIGELIDAACALDWLQVNNPESNYFLVGGFSFGAWVGMQLSMRRPEVNHYISIAPPVDNDKFDFSFLFPCPTPGLIVQGDQDSITSEEKVMEMVEKLGRTQHGKTEYKVISGADHFFREKESELSDVIDEYLLSKSSETGGIYDKEVLNKSRKNSGKDDFDSNSNSHSKIYIE